MPDYRDMFGQMKAPFTRLEVQTPKESSLFDVDQSFSCFALLDTGSPITYIPIDILDELNISALGEPEEIPVVGGRACFNPYIASVQLAGELQGYFILKRDLRKSSPCPALR